MFFYCILSLEPLLVALLSGGSIVSCKLMRVASTDILTAIARPAQSL